MALLRARESGIEPVVLLTTYNEGNDRIPIHEVPMEQIRHHSEVLGIRLRTVALPWPCSNVEYLARVGAALAEAAGEGIQNIVFGDIHLAEIRAFREQALAGTGLTPLFPLWGMEPAKLARDIIAAGIDATVSAVDETRLDRKFVGRRFDETLLGQLPAGVDPCGENGEFHTVVRL